MNTHIISKSEPLVYNGVTIDTKQDAMSLTAMWKASGSPANQDPGQWQRSASAEAFIEAVSVNMGISHNKLVESKKRGGTWAHWQVAFAYAKYLSPEFHMWCNEVVRERMEGKSVSVASLPPEVLEMIRRDDGISRMLAHKVTGIETTVQTLAATVAAMAGLIQPPGDGIYVTGKTAGEIWQSHGFPSLKITCWFSNRLVKMGCQLEGGRRLPYGVSRAKLFDPDKADLWLRNGGKALVEQYVKEKQGQRKLRLVGGEGA